MPKDVRFFVGEADEFYGTIDDIFAGRGALTARLGSLTEDAKGFVYFNNQRNRFGQIPIRLSPAMMHSDEAIAAVAKHELVELSLFRREFTRGGGRMTFDAFRAQAMPAWVVKCHPRIWKARGFWWTLTLQCGG